MSISINRVINNIILKMGNKLKEIVMKNRTYAFFDDMIKAKNLDPNKVKKDEKSNKIILMSQIVTVKYLRYIKTNSVNSFYFLSIK